MRADKVRLWLDRIPRSIMTSTPGGARVLGGEYTLVFPGTRGEARPRFSGDPSLSESQPLKGAVVTGQWPWSSLPQGGGVEAKTL
jgi:hypothetical protein